MSPSTTSIRSFEPAEISALVSRPVVEVHVSEAAFLWTQRSRAATSPRYKLSHLARLDRRLDAHLEGLRVNASTARSLAQQALAQADDGAVFVASYLAFYSGDLAQMNASLSLALSNVSFEKAARAALLWLDTDTPQGIVTGLCQAQDEMVRALGLSVLVAQRRDPGQALTQAMASAQPALRARALRACGDLHRVDQLTELARCTQHETDASVCASAWRALALLGQPDAAQALVDVAAKTPDKARPLIELAMRFGQAEWARVQMRAWAQSAGTLRWAIVAAGALGDPATVPWLLNHMADPQHARVAAEAMAMITGVDLDDSQFKQDAPEPSPELPEGAAAEDADLHWPQPAQLGQWWAANRAGLTAGQRYLAGRPILRESALAVLRDAYQRQRQAAALELSRLTAQASFPVQARAHWQLRRLQP